MTKLSEKLADLSARIGDLEARAEAFKAEQQDKRDRKVKELQDQVQAQWNELESAVSSKTDGVAEAWSSLNLSMREKAEAIRAQVEEKKDAFDATRADHRANRLEYNAQLAIDFAIVAMEEAELAAAEAIDARLYSDSLSK